MDTPHYQNLEVWKKSIELSKKIYALSDNFPKSEQYGLLDQMKRASVSIPSNIAEGSARGSIPDNIRFLHIAKGSCAELETQIILSKEFGFIKEELFEYLNILTSDIMKMLAGLISSKRKSI